MADKVQELLTLISALEMLKSTSKEAAAVYREAIEGEASTHSGGMVGYIKEITENAEIAAFALMQLQTEIDGISKGNVSRSDFGRQVEQAVRTVESRRTGAPKRNTETTELTQDELQRAADQYALTTPDSRSKSSGRMVIKNNTPRTSQPASDAPVNIIVSYLDKSGFFDKSDDYSDDMQEIVKELQEAVDDYKDPAQKAKKPQISRQIKTLFRKVTSASGTFSPTQVTNIQEDILKPVIEALKGVGADDEILQAGATRGASTDAIKSAVQRVVSMLVTEQSGKAVRVGESVVDNDMLQILKPGALDRVIRNLGGIVRRSAVKTVVPRGQTASLHLLNVMEDALGDTSALTVESKRDNDIPSSSDALSNTRVFPQFITKLGAYFNKFRQSMRASLNPSLRYGPEAQGVDTRTGSQIVAGSSSAVFGGGMDAAVQQAVDRLLAQVSEDISKGSMATARIAGSDVQLPQTLAKMVVEAIQTSSVLSEHTTAMGRMAGDKGPRGALETGDPIRKLIALFAGDLINQYRSTGGVSADAAQNFMDQTVTPPQEHEVTLALTHAMRLRERLTFQRDRADLDMVTASPQVAGAYRRDSIQLTKQIQLLDELLKVSDDPEEEKKLALRRGQIALPMNEEQAALTRDQALTVLLRMPIGSVPAMPDAVAPIVQKAQQVSSGLRESGLTVPVKPSYGTSPVQSLVDFFSAGQTQSLEKFQPIPLTQQLDEVSAPTSGLEQKDIVAIISDAFGLSRQSGSQGNAITGIFYGARATDDTGRIKTGDDLDQALGGGYRTKNGLRSIVQASAEMQSYGSSGIPLIDYARLATATGRTEEEESMFEQVKAKLPHLGSIGEDQLKELAALDTSMDPQALIKRVMTLAAPAIQAHLTAFIKKQAKTAGMTSEQTEQLIDSGSAGENVPAGFESAFRVLQMFDPKNINSNDVTSEVNRAFSLFSTMLTDIVQPNESMPQLAARLLGRENRLEGAGAPVAEALPDKNASFALLRAGGEVADTEAHRVTGSVYSRSVANQNNLTEALKEFEKLKAEIAELQSDISLKPEEADKITPIINQKIDQLQQVRQKLRLYYAAEPDPISMKFEALSTIVQSDTASDTEKADAVRDLALMQTIFKHTGRYVIDESQGFGSGTQEQRLAALLEHTEKEEKLADLKRQKAALRTGESKPISVPTRPAAAPATAPSTSSSLESLELKKTALQKRKQTVEAELEALLLSDTQSADRVKEQQQQIDEEIAKQQAAAAKDVTTSAVETAPETIDEPVNVEGVAGQGQVAGRQYVHPHQPGGTQYKYTAVSSSIPLQEGYAGLLRQSLLERGKIDVSPEESGTAAELAVSSGVAEALSLPLGPESIPNIPAEAPAGAPEVPTGAMSNAAGAIPYTMVPGIDEPVVALSQPTGAYKGRSAHMPVMGTIDPGQSHWAAAERETYEETGLTLSPSTDVVPIVTPTSKNVYFPRRIDSVRTGQMEFESQGVRFMPLSQAIRMISEQRGSSGQSGHDGRDGLEALMLMRDQHAQGLLDTTVPEEMPIAPTPTTASFGTEVEAQDELAKKQAELDNLEKINALRKASVALRGVSTRTKAPDFHGMDATGLKTKVEQIQPFFKVAEEQRLDYTNQDDLAKLRKHFEGSHRNRSNLKNQYELENSRMNRNIAPSNDEDMPLIMTALQSVGYTEDDLANFGEVPISADSPMAEISPMDYVKSILRTAPDELEGDDLFKHVLATVQDDSRLVNTSEGDVAQTARARIKQQVSRAVELPTKLEDSINSVNQAKTTLQLIDNLEVAAKGEEVSSDPFAEYAKYLVDLRSYVGERTEGSAERYRAVQRDFPDLLIPDLPEGLSPEETDVFVQSAINKVNADLAAMEIARQPTQRSHQIQSAEDVVQTRNTAIHDTPESIRNVSLEKYGQNTPMLGSIEFESVRKAQGMLGVPTIVPTEQSLLDTADQLLLDADGTPIIMYRAEDIDQMRARTGEVSSTFVGEDLQLAYPEGEGPTRGGRGAYGEGYYYAPTDSSRGVDRQVATAASNQYLKTGARAGGIRAIMTASALKKDAKLLDVTKEREAAEVEKTKQRLRDIGFNEEQIKHRLTDVHPLTQTIENEYFDKFGVEGKSLISARISKLAADAGVNEPFNADLLSAADVKLRGGVWSSEQEEQLDALIAQREAAPRYDTMAVALGYDASRYQAHSDVQLNVYNPSAVVQAAIPKMQTGYEGDPLYGSVAGSAAPVESLTDVLPTEREKIAQADQEIKRKQAELATLLTQLNELRAQSSSVTATVIESTDAQQAQKAQEIEQLDAQIAAAEKAVQRSRQQIAALQQQAEGGTGGDEEVYFTVDNTGGSVTLEEKQILDRTSLRPSVRTRMTAPDTGESLFVSNTNVPALVRAAQTVDPTTVDSVLASMTDEEMRRTGMPAAKLPEEFNWDQPSTLPKEWQKESGEPLTDEERAKLPETPAAYDASLVKQAAEARDTLQSNYYQEEYTADDPKQQSEINVAAETKRKSTATIAKFLETATRKQKQEYYRYMRAFDAETKTEEAILNFPEDGDPAELQELQKKAKEARATRLALDESLKGTPIFAAADAEIDRYNADLVLQDATRNSEYDNPLNQAVRDYYTTSSPDVKDSLIKSTPGLAERVRKITEAEESMTAADKQRAALWLPARVAAEKDATPEQLVSRLFREAEKAVREYADEFTTVPEFTARDVVDQLVSSAAAQTSTEAPATSPAVASAVGETLTEIVEKGLPALEGTGGTMGTKKKKPSPAATVADVERKYTAGQLKGARKTVRNLSGRADLTPEQRRRLSAARQKLHANAIQKLTTNFGDNKGVMQIANVVAGLTPPDWAADPVQSARVSAISEAMSGLSPFALKKLQDVDLTNSVDVDRLSKDEELRPIMEMLASQDIQQALSFKSGTQAYDTASGVIKAVETAKESLVEDSRGSADAEEKKKLFFDLETTMGSKSSERKIYQAASGSEGGDVEELFAVPVPSSAAAIQAVAADTTLTEDEKRKQIRELALKRVGKKPYVEGTDVNPKVIDRLVDHAMGGGTIHTQAGIKEILKGQIKGSAGVVGHNIAAFDLPIVYDDAVPKYVQAKTEDTLLMSRQAYPGDHSLSDTYMAVTGNPLLEAHDAAVDTRAVQEVYPSLATDEERRKLRARYLASRGIAPDSTVARLADIPQLDSIADDAERQKAFQQTAAAYTYYRPLAEMQDFTQNVVRSGGVTRIQGATDEQQATVFENMNKMFGTEIKARFGDGQTIETLDDKQLGEFIGYINDEYIKPNQSNAVDGDYGGMAQMLANKMGGPLTLRGFNRSNVADDFEKYATLEDRLAEGAMTGLSHDPTMTRVTVGEAVSDLSAGKPTTVSTTPSSSTKPSSPTTTGGTAAGGGVRPPGGGSGLTTAASPDGSGGGGGSGFSSIGQATIDSLHAQNVAIEINGGTVNIHANFTDSAASKMTKSLVYISNKDGMNVNGDVTGIGGGGGGGGYRRVSAADRASFNVLEATKNDVSARLRDETDPAVRDALRQSLVRASERTIDEVIKPKAARVLNPMQQSVFSSLSMGPEEALVSYNEMAQYNLNDLSTELATQEALPEGTAGRDTEIERLKAEIAAVQELIDALTELNAVEQRVGSASGTRNINTPYGTSSGTGTGTAAGKYYSRKSKEDEQVLLQLARNSFDQSGGSMGISGGSTTNDARQFLVDQTRKTSTAMIKSSGIDASQTVADIAAVAGADPEIQDTYDDAAKRLKDLSTKVGGSVDELADDLYQVASALEALKSRLTPLAATSPEAAASLAVVQTALDEVGAAGKEQRSSAGVIEADNRKKLLAVEEQMQAAASRPGFFAGGRRKREVRELAEGYLEDTFGKAGREMLMHGGRIRGYTATGRRVDMDMATVADQRETVKRLQAQGVNITAEDMTNIARLSGRVTQTQRSAPMGDKLFYAASKIRDTQSVVQAAVDTVNSLTNLPQLAGGMIQQFASSATGSNRVMTTARGLALNPENYTAALNAADLQRKQFGGSLTSNLGQVTSFIPLSNAYGVDIGKSVKVARKLAAFDPAQGMEGAGIAIKEFLSGNVSSLSRRFEINRSALSKINTGDATQMLDSLDQLLSSMGVTDRLIDEQANSMATKYEKMVGNLESLQISTTTAVVDFVTPTLESLIGEQSYFGKNVKERSLNTVLKETITSYGDDILSDPETGLDSVNIGGSLSTFTSQMDTILGAANKRMAGEAGRYNSATGASVSVPGYRLLGNMKPQERANIQFDALLGQAQGMNATQAIMQAMRNNPGDYNSSPEFLNQRESLKTRQVNADPAAYAEAYKKAEAGLLVADQGATDLSGLGLGYINFNAEPVKDKPLLTKGRVRKQVDADTYDIEIPGRKDLVRVRTGVIDAQEKGTQAELAARVGGADIVGMDRAMIGGEYKPGQGPEITLVGTLKNIDENNRVVAQLLNSEGKNYSLEMIATGNASSAFMQGLDKQTIDSLGYIEKVVADNGVGPQNRIARDLNLGGTPEISEEVRSSYFWNKYGLGLGGSTVAGAATGLGGAALATNATLGTTGLAGLGGLMAAEIAASIALPAVAAAGLYAGGAYVSDRLDSSPEKMRELYRMQSDLNQQNAKMEVFTNFAAEANLEAEQVGQYVGGAKYRSDKPSKEIVLAPGFGAGATIIPGTGASKKTAARIMEESTAELGKVYLANYEEASKSGQERFATAGDATKRILERQVYDPISKSMMSYVDYEAQTIAFKKTADVDPATYKKFDSMREEILKPIGQTGALIENEKLVERGIKYGTRLDKRALAEAKASPLRADIVDLTKKRDDAFGAGALAEGQRYQTQINAASAKIEKITYTDAEWDKIPESMRYLIMSAEEVANMTAEEIRLAADQTYAQGLNPTDYKQEAKNFFDGTMDRNFQRRQQRVDTTLTAFARQSIMGLGEQTASNLTGVNEDKSSGNMGLVMDNTPEARAVRMAQRSGLMPRNRAGAEDTVAMVTEAQKAAVREQLDIAKTNRQVALANAPEMQLLKSGFTNFAMYMNMAGATAEDLGRSFMNTMNMMSEGNPRYGLDLAQQMTGFSYEAMIGMQLRPRGNDEKGNPISSLNGLNGQPYSGSGPMVMPYTSGPRGTIAYSRDMMAVNANGVRENALGIAPSQWQQFVSNATNANAELQRRAMSNAIQERDLNKNHLRNLEDITRNGMRQLESIHLNYTRNMFQLTQQADLVKNMNRANMQRSVATADISEADRTQINKNIWARDMRAQHYGQGRADLFLESPDLAALTAIDPTLETDIAALRTASTAYDENADYYNPEATQALQDEKLTKTTPVLDKLKTAYANEKDPLKKAVIEKAIMTLSPDPNATVELQNSNVQETQYELGDAIARQQLGTQISDMEWQRSYRGLDIANNQQSMEEASKSKDPLALLNAGRNTEAMGRGFAQADRQLAAAQTNLNGLAATAPMMSTAYGQTFKNIDQNGTTAFQNILNGVDDFSISFQQQMEDALRNFDRQRLDMIQAFADAAVEIASIVPKEMIPIMQATSAFMNTQRQAELLWLSGRTDEANALAYQGMLKLGEVVYGEGKGKAYADKYSQNFEDMADIAARDVPQGDLGKFGVNTEDGWALRVKFTTAKEKKPEDKTRGRDNNPGAGGGPFDNKGGGDPIPK